jgi:Na+/melibiose symporter-like transporter
VAAGAEQDLVQVVALVVAVEDRLDARVELRGPVRDRVGVGRNLVLGVSPLRRSRDLRRLVAGQLLSTLGAQLTAVAVPYQVYVLTRSSLDVGLVSLATVLPLIAGALLGGSLADAADRRKILLGAQSLTLLCSAGLAVNADTGPALWPRRPWRQPSRRPS